MPVMTRLYADEETISGFYNAPLAARAGLNRTLDMCLHTATFTTLQTAFRDGLHRNPTAGELRLLSALQDLSAGTSAGEGVGELYTDSDELAKTWADAMEKHAALSQGQNTADTLPQPCTFDDLLHLTSRYLRRTGIRKDELTCNGHPLALLCTATDMAEAAARGYRFVCRFTATPGGDLTLFQGPAHPATGPQERAGDALLLVRRAPLSLVVDLTDPQDHREALLGNICSLAGCPLLSAVRTLCTGAHLYGDRLIAVDHPNEAGDVPIRALCAPGTATETCADYLIRVPQSRVLSLSSRLGTQGVVALVIGEVLNSPHLRVTLRTTPAGHQVKAVDLPFDWLHDIAAIRLRRVCAEGDLPVDRAPDSGVIPAVLRIQPHIIPMVDVPDGEETPATPPADPDAKSSVLRVPLGKEDVLLTAATVTVDTASGFYSAMQAVEMTVTALSNATGLPPQSMTLTAMLRGEVISPDRLTEVLCGLYRASATRALPLQTPTTAFSLPSSAACENAPLSLMVAAMVTRPANDTPPPET